jgi:hypothetical protein
LTTTGIAEAVDALSLSDQVRFIDEPERSTILNRVVDAFLEMPNARFWWEHLKVPDESWAIAHGYKYLAQLAGDPEDTCWFITGLTDNIDAMGVFECSPSVATNLLGECPAFEYALVDRSLQWLVIENHHDILIATGDARERLARLRA